MFQLFALDEELFQLLVGVVESVDVFKEELPQVYEEFEVPGLLFQLFALFDDEELFQLFDVFEGLEFEEELPQLLLFDG